MPSTTTLGTMLTQATRRANIENFVAESGTLITFPEMRDYCNEVSSEFHDLLVEARGQEFFRKAFTLSTSPNIGEYSLPSDFYELISVDFYIAPNQVMSGRPYMEGQRNRFRWYPGWYYNMPVYYRLLGTPQSKAAALQPMRINFIPQPASVNTIVLNYIPCFKPWATDGTEDGLQLDGVNGWESFIVWGVTAICLEKMEQNSEFALNRQAQIRQRIMDLAVDRDAGDAEVVADVTGDLEPFGFGG